MKDSNKAVRTRSQLVINQYLVLVIIIYFMKIRNRFTRKFTEDFNSFVFLKNHKRCSSLGKKCLYSEKNSVIDTFLVVIVGGFGLTTSIASKENLAEAKS